MTNNITVSASSNTVVEGDNVRLDFRRFGDLTQEETIYVSTVYDTNTDQSDFQAINRVPVTFRAGNSYEVFSFQTYNDRVREGEELIQVRVDSPAGIIDGKRYNQTLEVALKDALPQGPLPTYTVTYSPLNATAFEGDELSYRVKLDTAAHDGVSVYMSLENINNNQFGPSDLNLSAEQGGWMLAPGNIVKFAPGQDTVDVKISTKKDSFTELDETILVRNGGIPFADSGRYNLKFEGEVLLTLKDASAAPAPVAPAPVTPAPAAPAPLPVTNSLTNSPVITINGNNNFVNFGTIYNIRTTVIATTNNVFGTQNNDLLTGTAANDLMRGGKGDDIVRGGQGDDNIFGGLGSDTLNGGIGANTFDALEDGAADKVRFKADGKADLIRTMDTLDRVFVVGGTNLSFGAIDGGLGIFSNGVLEALYTGNNLTAQQLASQVATA